MRTFSLGVLLITAACLSRGAPGPDLTANLAVTWAEPHYVSAGTRFKLVLTGSGMTKPFGVSLQRTTDLAGNAVADPVVSGTAQPQDVLHSPGAVAELLIDLPEPGVYSIAVPPLPSLANWIIAFPKSTARLASSNVYCSSISKAIPLEGSFVSIPNLSPLVLVPLPDRISYVPVDVTGCTAIPGARQPVALCTGAIAHLDVVWAAFPGLQQQNLTVEPDPGVAFGLQVIGEESAPLGDLGDVAVGDVQAVDLPLPIPPFVLTSNQGPKVTLDGAPQPGIPSGCRDSGIAGEQLCNQLAITLAPGAKAGMHQIAVTTISGCTASYRVTVHPLPQVTSVGPAPICVGNGTARIQGKGLAFPRLFIDGAPGTVKDWCADETCVVADVSALAAGTHTAFVRSAYPVPIDSNAVSFETYPGPAHVGFPVPAIFAAGAARPFFAAVAGETGSAHRAFIQDLGDGGIWDASVADADGGVIVTTPPTAPAGQYGFAVVDDSPCPGQSGVVGIVASPIVASFDFTDGGQNALFGTSTSWTVAHWDADAGALTESVSAGPPNDFLIRVAAYRSDLGWLRFDLSACPYGSGSVQPASLQLEGWRTSGFTLSRAIGAPQCGWTHYDVPLGPDGWTFTDARGSRPATAVDFAEQITSVDIPATFWSVGNQAMLDNVSLELGH